MSAERYTLHADNTDWLDVRDPQGYRNTINQPGAIALIRQQSADIAELRAELNRERETNAVLRRDLAEPPPDIQELALKKCGHFEIVAKLRADLAAAVAERDEWKECAMSNLDERDKLRARLSAIDSAPVVAHIANKIGPDYFPCGLTILADSKLPPLGTDLIAKPAKD